ncbi:MAG: phosphodiesterase [Aeromonas sp.]
MKLAIFSDLHGDSAALSQVLHWLEAWQPDAYLLLGDLLNHGPRNPLPAGYAPSDVASRLNQLADKIIAVRGNCDSEVDQMLLNFPVLAPHNQALIDGRRWFMHHGHLYQARDLALPAGSVCLSGHTHVAGVTQQDGLILANPGSITFPRGEQPASFMRYSAGVLTLHALSDDRELQRWAL